MALIVLSLLVGFLCIFLVLLLSISRTAISFKANPYFTLILIIVGLQRFANALHGIAITTDNFSILNKLPILVFYFVPIYYLFFLRQLKLSQSLKMELIHFIIPTLILGINIMYVNFDLFGLIYIVFSTAYFTVIILKLKNYFLKKNVSIYDNIEGRKIKSWLLLMFITSIVTLGYTYAIVLSGLDYEISLGNFYIYTSLLWFLTLFYTFVNPVIIFGEKYFVKHINDNSYKEFKIWSTKPIESIQSKDQKLYTSISLKIDSTILTIKKLQDQNNVISKNTLTTKVIAQELKLPKSHIDLIFKYHCNYSVKEYSNLIKIKFALKLIRDGYLSKYTIASLGEKCLFNSRYTFYQNFKKYVGVSVNEFQANEGKNIMLSADH